MNTEESKLPKYAIGLDVGTNSIGWSVVREKDGESVEFIDCGSRIFIRSVEDKSPTPKNRKRRESRLQRRQVQRRSRRKSRLRNYLILKGFLPEVLKNNPTPEEDLNRLGNPYVIRAKALDEELTPHEFGRALLHLGTRRGFLSNRKTSFGDLDDDTDAREILEKEDEKAEGKDKEEGKLKEEIKKLRKNIDKSGARTLGEYLAGLSRKRNRGDFHDRYTDRKMYKEEFSEIWKKQSSYNPKLYNEETKNELEKIIFSQRPLKLKPDRVGRCSLEPNLPRTRQGRLEFQRFRYWQDINNLSYQDLETGETEIRLSKEQKKKLAEALETKRELTWAKIRSLLGLKKKTSFNLQEVEGKKKGLKGNRTAHDITEVIGDKWNSLSESEQFLLVEDIISYTSKKGLKKRLADHWNFSEEEATRLAVVELEENHANLSLKAIKKILLHLKEGQIYSEAIKTAGYEIAQPKSDNLNSLPSPPWIPNPIVQKALHEIHRVVNAIIRKYGKPSAIRIEMARDLEMNTKRYKQFIARQSENTKANERAEEHYGIIRDKNPHLKLRKNISYQDRLKYRLWEESGKRCTYSGKSIGMTELFTHATEIDHILPYKRTLDNSYMNKVICLSQENREKRNKTPWEAFGGTPRWDQILMTSKDFPPPKRKRILTKELDDIDDFISNQLNDTRYISREAGKYLKSLGCDISFTKGGATSWLRHQWGLNSLLGGSEEKNRDDHRHHAIDATVIALTNRSLYQKIVRLIPDSENSSISPEHGMEVPPQIPELRDDLSQRLDNLIVSHSTKRKLAGAFHEETAYGIKKGTNGKPGVVVRKMLVDMTDRDKEKIVCPAIKRAVELYVWERGGKTKEAMKHLQENPLLHPKTGDKIRRVRVWASETLNRDSYWEHIAPWDKNKILRILPYGNNHHVEIIRNCENGKYESRFVNTMEAAKRARRLREPIICRDHGKDWEYITYLCINDTVSIEENRKRNFYRVQKFQPNEKVLVLRLLNAATLKNNNERRLRTIAVLMRDLKMRKESVDALGYLSAKKD